MNLIVDHARNEMQSTSINDFIGRRMHRGIDYGDLVIFDKHRNADRFRRQHNLSMADESFHTARM